MCQATLCQFDLKSVLAMRFGVAQLSFRGTAEVCGIRRLAGEDGFGFVRPPRFSPYAAQGDARISHISACNFDHHGCRSQCEFIRRAVAQLEIYLPASRSGRRQSDVRDEVARLEHGFTMWGVSGQKMKVAKG